MHLDVFRLIGVRHSAQELPNLEHVEPSSRYRSARAANLYRRPRIPDAQGKRVYAVWSVSLFSPYMVAMPFVHVESDVVYAIHEGGWQDGVLYLLVQPH